MDTYLVASVKHPSSIPGRFDAANLRAKFGMRRLRAETSLIVDRFKWSGSDDVYHASDTFKRESFDPESSERYGAPVIAEFSTQPLPLFKTVKEPNGGTFTSIVGDTIGKKSSADLVFGQIIPNTPIHLTASGRKISFGARRWASPRRPPS